MTVDALSIETGNRRDRLIPAWSGGLEQWFRSGSAANPMEKGMQAECYRAIVKKRATESSLVQYLLRSLELKEGDMRSGRQHWSDKLDN